MQARGHQSISPPEQITQPRHGNQVSNTPPPQAAQQYYNPGPGYQRFEYLQQQDPSLLQYKAYGSALNEPRAPGNGARVGLQQQPNIQQTTGNYYQQPTQNMRPPQPQQGPAAQQYYISTQPAQPRGIRPQQQITSPTMLYVQSPFQGNNVVIPANMYPRMQQYPQVSYPQYAPTYNVFYPTNGWPNAGLPQTAQNTRPESREKRILSITDPNTGRDITTEIFKTHHADSEDHHEEVPPVNQSNQEICKTFTRLVADRLKAPDESNSSSATEGHVIGLTSGVSVTTQPSQFQQPTQHQQPGPVLMTHSRPALIHPSGAATPPQEIPYVDTTIPPPNIRPSAPMYNSQQQSHGNARLVQPHQPPQIRPQMAHVQSSQQHAAAVILPTQITQPSQPSHSSQGLSSGVNDAPKSVPQRLVTANEKSDNDTPRPDVLVKPNLQPQSVKVALPVQEEIHISPVAENDVEIKLASVPPEPVKEKTSSGEMSQIPDESVTEETSAKDGKKITNNKKKKDINKKEIVGSEMDAFMDPSVQAREPVALTTEINRKENVQKPVVKVILSSAASETSKNDVINVEVKQNTKCFNVDTGVMKLNLETNHYNTVHIQKPADTPVQVESKHKLKKKKKKKGRKTPPIQKSKQSTSANETVEGSLHTGDQCLKQTSDTPKVEDKENETVETKPPISPPADEVKNAKDKTSTKEVKPPVDVTTDKKSTVVKEVMISPSETVDHQFKSIETALDKEPVKTLAVEQTTFSPAVTQPVSTEVPSNESADIFQKNQMEQTEIPSFLSNSPSVEKINEKNIQSKKTTENEIAKDPLLKSQIDDGKKNSPSTDISTPNKPVPDTMPVKTDGKEMRRCYDRAQLMELRNCVSSQIKPKGLPNFEIIMDSPNEPIRSTALATDFTPIFFQPTPGNARHPASMGKTSSRGRQRPGDATRIIKPISANDKPLHQSEKPWKPTQKLVHSGEIAEKRKTLESDVLFIMNRLTPTNFERLAGEMRNLNIQSYEELTDLVKIFFDKVTMETKFVEAYAQLCKVMSSIKVPPPTGVKDNQSTFRVVMLTKCQQEFEADKSIVFEDPEEKKKKIEAEMPEGPERNEKIDAVLYQMKLKRLKFYGNIRFIGELFKLGMLTENIMHDCIFRLLKARDDDSLVSLCQLLTTVGQVLDTDKAKTRMDQYFNQMAKIAEERKSRIKFTLKDAIDLRSNNWVPRKEQTGPKKIDEVHKDFQQEQYTKQLMQSQPPPPRTDTVQPNSRRGSRQRQDELKMAQDDGWNTVGSKSLRIDASKMKLSKNVVDENSIQLGPGGGISKFSMWGRGSYGGSQPVQEDRQAPTNRYTLLRGGGGEEDRRSYQKSPSRGDNVANRGIRQGPTAGHGRGKIISRSITEGERRDALGNTWPVSGGRSQNSSRDNSWNREDHRTLGPRGSRERDIMTASDITLRPSSEISGAIADGDFDELGIKKIQPLSEKEMEHKAKTILEEYLSVMDLEEAKLCLKELKGQSYLDILVSSCINDVLEKSKQKRELTGHFFHEMVRNKLIPLDIYFKGLSEVLQIAEDMVIDIPMIWSYLAQIIAPLLIGGSVPWCNLIPTLKNNLDNRCCAKLLSEILLIAKETKGENEAALMWQSTGLKWSVFMDEADVEKFTQDKKLEFTLHPVKASLQSKTSQIIFERITEDIERIAKDGGSNKDIFSYIEKNVPKEMQGNEFLRALTTAIASSSITSTKKANEEAIKNCIKSHKDVLQHFIKSNVDLELQALYAIQALMHRLEHPSNVMGTLFDVLYDEDIISEEACKKWETSTDPLEAEGKGACLMQLTQFFAWLKENEEPEPS